MFIVVGVDARNSVAWLGFNSTILKSYYRKENPGLAAVVVGSSPSSSAIKIREDMLLTMVANSDTILTQIRR